MFMIGIRNVIGEIPQEHWMMTSPNFYDFRIFLDLADVLFSHFFD